MKVEIKHRWNGKVLFSVEAKSLKASLEIAVGSSADLSYADLSYADLSSANLNSANLSYANLNYADLNSADLSYADLSYADLSSANLNSANLSYADLSSADLSSADLNSADLNSANLSSANLNYAEGINKYLCTPLLILHEQVGKIRAYKLVNRKSEGPWSSGIIYKIGKMVGVDNIDECETKQCGKGINLATLDWCMKNWEKGYRILIAEFPRYIRKNGQKINNIVVPIATDGKFRVRRARIVGEKDLIEIGLIKQ